MMSISSLPLNSLQAIGEGGGGKFVPADCTKWLFEDWLQFEDVVDDSDDIGEAGAKLIHLPKPSFIIESSGTWDEPLEEDCIVLLLDGCGGCWWLEDGQWSGLEVLCSWLYEERGVYQ